MPLDQNPRQTLIRFGCQNDRHWCQISAPRWPNDISSAADNAIFNNRAQNINCSFSCVPCSAILLKPNVVNILLFNFCEQKFVQHGPITIAIDYNGLSLLIFEEKLPNYASAPKSAPNSDWFWVCRLFNVWVRVFCASNATILLVYIPAKIKMRFIWKDDFFLPKSTSSVSRSYTQPYSFGGRIKSTICQLRPELTVTIHEMNTSRIKNVRWRTPYEGKSVCVFYSTASRLFPRIL